MIVKILKDVNISISRPKW